MDAISAKHAATCKHGTRPRFADGVRAARTFLLEPRLKGEDERRREYLLNVMLAGSVLLTGLLTASVLWNSLQDGYEGVSNLGFTLVFAGFCGLLALSRKGLVFIAAYATIALYAAGVAYAGWRWGMDLPSSLLGTALVILMAGMLLSARAGMRMAAAMTALMVVIGQAQSSARSLADGSWKLSPLNTNDLIEYALLLGFITGLSWLSNREIERSLRRARESEALLTAERDLLEHKVAERTRELRQAEFEKTSHMHRLAEFGKLSAGLFHDMMNPVNEVLLRIEQLKAVPQETVDVTRTDLRKVFGAADRMRTFLRALYQQVQQQDSLSLFAIDEEARNALRVLSHKAERAGVTLRLAPAEPLQTFGSAFRFHQLVTNLVSNAIDASENAARKEVLVGIAQEGSEAVLSVRDWGAGIPGQDAEAIFEPFFTTKSPDKGLGIGLTVARTSVEKHFGGSIAVSAAQPNGSLFTVRFALRLPPES